MKKTDFAVQIESPRRVCCACVVMNHIADFPSTPDDLKTHNRIKKKRKERGNRRDCVFSASKSASIVIATLLEDCEIFLSNLTNNWKEIVSKISFKSSSKHFI